MDVKPEFTIVNEDFPYERNAEFTLLGNLFYFIVSTALLKIASPASVRGCFKRPSIAESGQVATSAPASRQATMCCV